MFLIQNSKFTMKKFMSIAAIFVAMVSTVLFTSCGSDDSNGSTEVPTAAAAEEVAGTYTCNGTLTVMNKENKVTDASYKFEKKTDNTVTLTIPATGEGAKAFPDLPVEGVSVTKNDDGTYDLSLEKGTYTTSEAGEDKSYTIEALTGTVKSDGTIVLAYSLQYGVMPMPMVATLTGTKNK